MQKPIQLYYWPTPNGYKISIMLEECKLPYEVNYINIGRGDQFDPDFLKIAPNNRMPAIVDPEGPGRRKLSLFESGAILQYLGRKTGKFYPDKERNRAEVDQWLHWQMGGVGPMAGQAHHFRNYAPKKIPYAIDRYTDEVNRLYGVLNGQLKGKKYLAGSYSIADMATFPWARLYKNQGQNLRKFPHMSAWLKRIEARPAVKRALVVGKEERAKHNIATDKKAQSVLFGQRAR